MYIVYTGYKYSKYSQQIKVNYTAVYFSLLVFFQGQF